MKVILYMEVTANGFIARQDSETDWISDEAWNSYAQVMAGMDAVIIGKKTYDLMSENEFQKNTEYIVITSNTPAKGKVPNITFTNDSPNLIVKSLQGKMTKNVCVAGGGIINSFFMKAGLVDEIFLDVEPFLFGQGIQLFAPCDFEYRLELLNTKKLNSNTMQLHYKVVK